MSSIRLVTYFSTKSSRLIEGGTDHYALAWINKYEAQSSSRIMLGPGNTE